MQTISVITPSYNQGEYLEQTIASVLSQEGEFRVDYVIMDGGSTDASVDVIKKYDAMLKNGERQVGCRGISFRWSSEKDKGQVDAINKGFREASGSVVAWLNSDDCYVPGALQAVADLFAGHPEIDVVYGDTQYVDSAGEPLFDRRSVPFVRMYLLRGLGVQQPSVFFRKSVIERIGFLDESLSFVFDNDYWIRMVQAGCRCHHIEKILSRYRFHDKAKTYDSSALLPEMLTVVKRYGDRDDLAAAYGKACYDYARACGMGPLRAHETLLDKARFNVDGFTREDVAALFEGMCGAVYQYADHSYARAQFRTARHVIRAAFKRYPRCITHARLLGLYMKCMLGPQSVALLKNLKRRG